MNKKTLPLRSLTITLLLLAGVVATGMAQSVGDKFKVDKLYYEVTKLSPAEVQLVRQNTDYPYWNAGEAPTGTLTLPEKVTHNGKEYAVTSIGGYAFGYCRSLSSVSIPSSVTSIGDFAFAVCSSLSSVAIPNSVTSIGVAAFWGCSSLTTVTIGNSVISIGESAFSACSSLTAVTIGNSVTSIGESAFEDCSSLSSVTIGNSVTSIGESAFSLCSSLVAIVTKIEDPSTVTMEYGVFEGVDKNTCVLYVPSGKVSAYQGAEQWKDFVNITEEKDYSPLIGTKFKSDGLYYVISSKNTVKLVPQNTGIPSWNDSDKPTGNLTLPEKVTHNGQDYTVISIGRSAFNGCSSLTTVTIPKSVTSIGGWAFVFCSSLTAINVAGGNTTYSSDKGILFNKAKTTLIKYPAGKPETEYTIPNSVTSIGDGAFASCGSLTTVTIPNSVISIGKEAFEYCSSLSSVTIGNSVTSIGDWAFSECSSLTAVTIPHSVTSIGDFAFAVCSSLSSVAIPNSVTSIGVGAFGGCSSLTAINVAEGNTAYSSDKGVLFNQTKTTLITYPAGKPETEYTIPHSVTSIEGYAFVSCSFLSAVTIPNSVTSIAESPFSYCSSLTAIISKIEDPSKVTMGYNVFKDVDKNTCIVYVPSGKVSVYKGAKQWKDFKNIKEATTGVKLNDGVAHTVSIYPTLVENGFTVESTGKVLEIYNLSGQRVQTVPLTSNKQFVNVSNLRQGVYLAKVKDWAVRFVKQ